MVEKFKAFLYDDTVYLSLILILVAVAAFGLGRFSTESTQVGSEDMVRVEYAPLSQVPANNSQNTEGANDTVVVGSKNGSKYHLPDCPGAKQIAEKNLLQFASVVAAESAGYSPAANCDGL